MKRGRPLRSVIRQNIVEILHHIDKSYGYEIAKMYLEIFPAVTQRSIYYHLRKGVMTKEFEVHEIRKEKGDFSWGSVVEKTYYSLGKDAQPKGDNRVKEYVEKWKKKEPEKGKLAFMKSLFGKK